MTATQHQPPLVSYSPTVRCADVGWICLNRPGQRNAFNIEMALALRDAVTAFESDPSTHVAILGAKGPVFCAGMGLAAFAAGEAGLE